MSQKIKIQDGIITYATPDPTLEIKFNVDGQVNVSSEINVGNDNSAPGIITTPDDNNTDLNITTGTGGHLSINQNASGTLSLNNVQWPTGIVSLNPGMYLGATSLNTLDYLSFVIGSNSSDTLTSSQLNALFPSAQPGQVVTGTTVVYYCTGSGQWRTLGATSVAGGSSSPPVFVVKLFATNTSSMNRNMMSVWNSSVEQTSTEAAWDSYSSNLVLNVVGLWKITVRGYAQPTGNWPDNITAYGTYISEALSYTQLSQYFRGNGTMSQLSSDAQISSWTDEFIVECTATPMGVSIAMFAESYNTSIDVTFNSVVTAQRISP